MADNSDSTSREERAGSHPKEIPIKQSAINIDFNSASFVSQRSSSLETFGSVTSLNSSDGNTAEPQTCKNQDKNASAVSKESTLENSNMTASRDSGNDSSSTEGNRDEPSSDSQTWMCNNESLPASMLHPAHRSTPVKDCEYLSTVSEEGGEATLDEDADEDKEDGGQERTVYLPGDLSTPILGYETMESRSRFTVFKIHVHKAATDAESSGWFVFRRYSDFLHLNERLKYQFPGFRLALPPKRWFRDNFDSNFLEDRVLGLQAFLDNITGHKDILNSAAVRAFLCIDDPPGPHDSLEESRALCETLEESVYSLKQDLTEKETEVTLLKEELELYKSQVELLSNQLRVVTGSAPTKGEEALTPSSTRHSLAECDRDTPPSPVTGEAKSGDELQAQDTQHSEETSSSTE